MPGDNNFIDLPNNSGTSVSIITTAVAQNPNVFLGGPTSGAPGFPTFRPLTIQDFPPGVGTGTVTSVALSSSAASLFTVTGSPISSSGTIILQPIIQASGLVYAGPTSGGDSQSPIFRRLQSSDLPGGVGSVTSVSFASSAPSLFTVSGSPITSAGTITIQEVIQTSGLIFASPTSGADSQAPLFRRIQTSDLPSTVGTVQSVSFASSAPSLFTVTGSPVTTTGTITIQEVIQSSATVFAGPATGADSAAPTFRTLTSTDIPVINLSTSGPGGVTGTLPSAQVGVVSLASSGVGAVKDTLPRVSVQSINLSAGDVNGGVTGVLPVANGGSSSGAFAANAVLLGNNAAVFQTVTPGNSGNVLTSNGTTWASAVPAGGGLTTSPDGSLVVTSSSGTVNANWLYGNALINGYLSYAVASSALTISLKNVSGSDPSSGNPVKIAFRNNFPSSGDYTVLSSTSGTSLTISSGSTLGIQNSSACRIWTVGFNDAGTFRLGAINCTSGNNIFPLRESIITSSVAEGGAGAADSAQTFYTGAAVASRSLRVLGYAEWNRVDMTAGGWVLPHMVQAYGHGIALPGAIVQQARIVDGAVATGATTWPITDNIPDNSLGTQFLAQSIRPLAAPNILKVSSLFNVSPSAQDAVSAALFQDSAVNAVASAYLTFLSQANGRAHGTLFHNTVAGSTALTTFRCRVGGNSTTITFNGSAGSREFGGTLCSFLEIDEAMG